MEIEQTLSRIPPEAWPFLVMLGNITAAVTAVWIAISVFVWWRRSASNLTPVSAARKNRSARPDFLEGDTKARKEAIARGEAFDRALDARDAEEERDRKRGLKQAGRVGTFARWVALAMSVFTLATMVSGTIFQVSYMGKLWEQYSAGERLVIVVQKHPFTFAVGALVVVYHVIKFFTEKKWQSEE
jgi:hypothetical protein